MLRGVLIAGAFSLAPFGAYAQGSISVEKLSFDVRGAFEKGAAVSGDLRIPQSTQARLPAVLILHSSPGFDGRGAFYAEALNLAGIASVEIDYLRGKGMPATPRHNLPHVYETLRTLASHPRIDPARIGVLGFSWGGILSILAASEELTKHHTGGNPRFAAHLGIYPICWIHQSVAAGKSKDFQASVYRQVTGKPVHILAGDKDGYDLSLIHI